MDSQHAAIGRCRTGGIAFTIPMSNFFQTTLAIFWLVAFSSATHDIAADGFYMLALNVQDQALYVGIRSTFYRIATIAGQGLLVMLAGGLKYGQAALSMDGVSRSLFWQDSSSLSVSIINVYCQSPTAIKQ